MRDIYFRGKRKQDGKFAYGSLIHVQRIDCKTTDEWEIFTGDIIDYDEYCTAEIMRKTIEQYTGLKDKNGKEIYEGDIVKSGSDIGCVEFGRYGGTNYGFYIKWITDKIQLLRNDILYWLEKTEIEVIGNVFDNPELLEGIK